MCDCCTRGETETQETEFPDRIEVVVVCPKCGKVLNRYTIWKHKSQE